MSKNNLYLRDPKSNQTGWKIPRAPLRWLADRLRREPSARQRGAVYMRPDFRSQRFTALIPEFSADPVSSTEKTISQKQFHGQNTSFSAA